MGNRKVKHIPLEVGSIFQRISGGSFHYRFQVDGKRKTISLGTSDEKEAMEKARQQIPIIRSDTASVIAEHVKVAKKLEYRKQPLPLHKVWETYAKHPEHSDSLPHEIKMYQADFSQFADFTGPDRDLREVTQADAAVFADHLRDMPIAVGTHNRKIIHIKRIFKTLLDDTAQNPFQAKTLLRKEREEQGLYPHRTSFTSEQEQALLLELENPKRKLMNKEEIWMIHHMGMYTGQRLKDCVLLRWDKVDLRGKRIWVKQFKTGKEVTLPIAEPLMKAFVKAQKWSDETGYVCPKSARRYNKTDSKGDNVGNNLVNIDVLRPIRWIGLTPSVKVDGRKKRITVYGFHSHRHYFVSACAEHGVPAATVASIIGDNSDIIQKYYVHVGSAAQMEAIKAVSASIDNIARTPQNRIDDAVRLIDSSNEQPGEVLKSVRSILCD